MGSGAPDGAPDAAILSGTEAHKEEGREKEEKRKSRSSKTRQQGKKGGKGSPQAHKRGYPPPIGREQAAVPLITNSRQKISKKSLGVDLKKFSEKFFVGMFRVKKNPSRYLNGRGCTNENREISNLANANKPKNKSTKTECKGR